MVAWIKTNFEFVIVILGAIVALTGVQWKVENWMEKKGNKKQLLVWRITLGVVTEIYYEFVRPTKAANEDHKLTAEQKMEALNRALAIIRSRLLAKGVDAVKIDGGLAYVKRLIERAVQELKVPEKVDA